MGYLNGLLEVQVETEPAKQAAGAEQVFRQIKQSFYSVEPKMSAKAREILMGAG